MLKDIFILFLLGFAAQKTTMTLKPIELTSKLKFG